MTACHSNKSKSEDRLPVQVNVPVFNADSAYTFVERQVDFGPRVPNTEAHVACGDYLVETLGRLGAVVETQEVALTAYDGTTLRARNIIGQYQPEKKKRILLCAHWDSRPWADQDADAANHRTPILGANDGASGVGVLLEIGRQLQLQEPTLGVDLIFFDAEDYGQHADDVSSTANNSWCLGSQYWSRQPHREGYTARFGILLDMVGGLHPRFCQERFSNRYAASVVDKVWKTAQALGYGSFFPFEAGGYTTDDHLPINEVRRIPCIDLIPYDENEGFGSTWHTLGDTMDAIHKETLQAVGQTVLQVVYNEK